MQKKAFLATIVVLLAGIAAWYGFKPDAGEKQASAKRPAQQAATVSTAVAKQMNVPVQLQANGYVSSLNSVDIRPQVSNVVARVHIKEGQFVKAGETLFSLDDRADRVNLQKAEAQLAKDRASLADAERQLARSQELLSKGFIARSAVDTVQSQVDAQQANLRADMAAVEAARVSLSYQVLRAPASGRAGAINVFSGSLVQPNMATPMVTISQLDPIAATFTVPETELAALLAAQRTDLRAIKVSANLQEARHPVEGELSFIDNAVDPQNGTIRVKAIFPNKEQLLWPGQYVSIKAVIRELKDAIVIPQAAIITGVDSKTVYAVGPDRTAQMRRIEVVYPFGADAVVTGLKAGEIIVVDGKQNLRQGTRVRDAAAAPANGPKDGKVL
jgi:multidrug efflux system membrane fusion protein